MAKKSIQEQLNGWSHEALRREIRDSVPNSDYRQWLRFQPAYDEWLPVKGAGIGGGTGLIIGSSLGALTGKNTGRLKSAIIGGLLLGVTGAGIGGVIGDNIGVSRAESSIKNMYK